MISQIQRWSSTSILNGNENNVRMIQEAVHSKHCHMIQTTLEKVAVLTDSSYTILRKISRYTASANTLPNLG
jgi:hypothetical protein